MVHSCVVVFPVKTSSRLENSIRVTFPLVFSTCELGVLFAARVHEWYVRQEVDLLTNHRSATSGEHSCQVVFHKQNSK